MRPPRVFANATTVSINSDSFLSRGTMKGLNSTSSVSPVAMSRRACCSTGRTSGSSSKTRCTCDRDTSPSKLFDWCTSAAQTAQCVLRNVEFDSSIWGSNGNIASLPAFVKQDLKLHLFRRTVDVQSKCHSYFPFCGDDSAPRVWDDDDELVLMSRARRRSTARQTKHPFGNGAFSPHVRRKPERHDRSTGHTRS